MLAIPPKRRDISEFTFNSIKLGSRNRRMQPMVFTSPSRRAFQEDFNYSINRRNRGSCAGVVLSWGKRENSPETGWVGAKEKPHMPSLPRCAVGIASRT